MLNFRIRDKGYIKKITPIIKDKKPQENELYFDCLILKVKEIELYINQPNEECYNYDIYKLALLANPGDGEDFEFETIEYVAVEKE